MSFLDDMSGVIDRGAAAVGRTTKSAQLKMQLSDLEKKRRDVAAELGASLYEVTRDNPELRAGREGIYDDIATIDGQLDNLLAQLQEVEAASAAAQRGGFAGVLCPRCEGEIRDGDSFCMGCGMPADEARAEIAQQAQAVVEEASQVAGPTCPNCGNAISETDMFCMKCGARLGEAPPVVMNVPQI